MVNYNKGKIYKIEPLNGEEGDIYIGSTTKEYLSQRMDTHRSNYKRFLNDKTTNVTTSHKIFNKYGIENCKIVLLELVNVNSNDELLARETHYIKLLKCVNKNIPLRTPKEYYEDNKDKIINCEKNKMKEYNEAIKDKIKEYQDKLKESYETKKIKRKAYYEDNKDIIKQKAKEHYEDNKDKINKKRRAQRQLKKHQL